MHFCLRHTIAVRVLLRVFFQGIQNLLSVCTLVRCMPHESILFHRENADQSLLCKNLHGLFCLFSGQRREFGKLRHRSHCFCVLFHMQFNYIFGGTGLLLLQGIQNLLGKSFLLHRIWFQYHTAPDCLHRRIEPHNKSVPSPEGDLLFHSKLDISAFSRSKSLIAQKDSAAQYLAGTAEEMQPCVV